MAAAAGVSSIFGDEAGSAHIGENCPKSGKSHSAKMRLRIFPASPLWQAVTRIARCARCRHETCDSANGVNVIRSDATRMNARERSRGGKGSCRESHHKEDHQKEKRNKGIRGDGRSAAMCKPRLEYPHAFLPRMTSGEAWTRIAANNARNRGSRRLYLVLIMAQNPWDAPSSALVESRTALHYDSSAAHLGRERHAMP